MLTTAEQLKARFQAEGQTVAGWARENGYGHMQVYQVLNGTVKGKYGMGHEIAVKLGLKPAPGTQTTQNRTK